MRSFGRKNLWIIRHADVVAMAASLALHAGALYTGLKAARSEFAPAELPTSDQPIQVNSQVYIERYAQNAQAPPPEMPDSPKPEKLPPPKEETPLPEPPSKEPELTPVIIPPMALAAANPVWTPPRADSFGELTGTIGATALHSVAGEQPMQAREGPRDQAALDRSPGEPTQAVTAEVHPKAEVTAVHEAEQPKSRNVPKEAAPQQMTLDDKPADSRPDDDGPTADPLSGPGRPIEIASNSLHPQPPADPALVASPTVSVPRPVLPPPAASATRSEASAQNSAGGKASTSDSDAFSTEGSAEFRPGRVKAAFGRRVKTVRPKLSLAGQFDLLGNVVPQVELRVRVDDTGTVRHVSVEKSSGSSQIDEACQLAMYEWWFEPPRDGSGKPMASELHWTISFRH